MAPLLSRSCNHLPIYLKLSHFFVVDLAVELLPGLDAIGESKSDHCRQVAKGRLCVPELVVSAEANSEMMRAALSMK